MPLSKRPDFVVNTNADGQFAPAITALPNGRFFVAWESGVYGTDNTVVRGRLFEASGVPIFDDFVISTSSGIGKHAPSLTTLADGSFVAAWQAYEGISPGFDVRGRLFNDNGIALGTDFVINGTTAERQFNPVIAARASGGFIAAWTSEEGRSLSPDIRGRLFNVSGSAAGADFVINSTTGLSQSGAAIAVLKGGGIIVAWTSEVGDDRELTVRGRVLKANGTALGPDFIINETVPDGQSSPAITALASGGFVATWNSDVGGAGYDVRGRVFKSDGKATGREFVISNTTSDDQFSPTIAALADGRFIAAWASVESGTSQVDIRARLFNANGAAAGDDFIVNSTLADNQRDPTVTVLTNGRIAIAWEDDSAAAPKSEIRATIVNPNIFVGTTEEDAWSGGKGKDTLNGGGGKDTLKGNSGDDVINGGTGDDSLNGGAGADTLNGGTGKDKLTGGDGKDKLTGSVGADKFIYTTVKQGGDRISDFKGNDFLVFDDVAFAHTGLGKARFTSQLDDHKATGTKAQFIFDQSTDQLWFDSNGTKPGGATMMADLNNFNLQSGDILIV